jgi:chemotaxis protein MotB
MPQDSGAKAAGAIFIKRVKKGGHAAHGGAWKIAYADFVTAMMAFFLLLWLLNSVTQEQLEGISNYFAPAAPAATTSGAGGVLGGQTLTVDGSQASAKSAPSVSLALPPPRSGLGGDDSQTPKKEEEKEQENDPAKVSEDALKKKEEEQFEKAKDELRQALQGIPSAAVLAKSLLVDNTPEGLRIQLVDQEGFPMFQSGGAELMPRARELLQMVAKVVETLPQKIAISGHTDSVPFGRGTAYGNWELSSDRANSTRRTLLDMGVPIARIDRVVGKADTEPLLKEDPANARNRRLSVILLRATGDNDVAGAQQIGNGKGAPKADDAPARRIDITGRGQKK